jgi:RimJ/RimL family protein N-acetyltransferase
VTLRFAAPFEVEPGVISRLLRESYADLIEAEPDPWRSEARRWDEFDAEVFAHSDTVGECTRLTWCGEELVGLLSYDPRGRPAYGVIGHNCVLPAFRGRGFGTAQVREILRRFDEMGIGLAKVSTCDHPFFVPAQRMYESVGFREVRRDRDRGDVRSRLVHYELDRWPTGRGPADIDSESRSERRSRTPGD